MWKVKECAQHSVCFLAFTEWLLGGATIGYMMWVLGTSPTTKEFLNGRLVFTYVILGVGSLLFLAGLLGWVGSYRRGGCLLNLFLFLTVLSLASEVGGIIALNIMQTKMTDILSQAWSEVNQETRNILQEKFECCGFLGPKDFIEDVETSNNNCYLKESTFSASVRKIETDLNKFQVGCKEYLVEWFYQNKVIWIVALGAVLLLQVVNVLVAVLLINQNKRSRRSSSTQSLRESMHQSRI
ncbi:CD82 antigen-like isoform X1 [Limulus polyphemus]|uniref:Tetraspanin n=1 Tax=Limulus polyphemus TaxID=6850 RepID=A0ABM1BX15_LIMPO|nr:CD82 antigen-like isoform X1 [Limulus polyphemus]